MYMFITLFTELSQFQKQHLMPQKLAGWYVQCIEQYFVRTLYRTMFDTYTYRTIFGTYSLSSNVSYVHSIELYFDTYTVSNNNWYVHCIEQ